MSVQLCVETPRDKESLMEIDHGSGRPSTGTERRALGIPEMSSGFRGLPFENMAKTRHSLVLERDELSIIRPFLGLGFPARVRTCHVKSARARTGPRVPRKLRT